MFLKMLRKWNCKSKKRAGAQSSARGYANGIYSWQSTSSGGIEKQEGISSEGGLYKQERPYRFKHQGTAGAEREMESLLVSWKAMPENKVRLKANLFDCVWDLEPRYARRSWGTLTVMRTCTAKEIVTRRSLATTTRLPKSRGPADFSRAFVISMSLEEFDTITLSLELTTFFFNFYTLAMLFSNSCNN